MTRLATPTPQTATGTILGTVQYMAPEQVEGHEADARSDIWALGAVIYEMVTGTRPFSGRLSRVDHRLDSERHAAADLVAPAALTSDTRPCGAALPGKRS